jgi:hypothetical protein
MRIAVSPDYILTLNVRKRKETGGNEAEEGRKINPTGQFTTILLKIHL